MASTLPLYINNQKITIDQLSGNNYVAGYPELMALFVIHQQDPNLGYTQTPTFIFPTPGKQTFYATPGKSWKPGMRLRAYRFGNGADFRTLIVYDYDAITGKVRAEVVASGLFTTPELNVSGYFLTPYFGEQVGAAVLGFANGGTGGTNVEDARKGLQFNNNKWFSTLFADFVLPNNYCRYIVAGVDQGPAVDAATGISLDYDFSVHPGVFKLTAGQAGTNIAASLQFGKNYDYDWADFSGDETVFEADILIPALGTSGAYTLEIGLLGPTAKICVQYKDTLNTGRFQIITGVSSSFATFNTTLAAAATTWYKIRMEIISTNISIQINGANGTTVAKGIFQGVSTGNRMTPMIRATSNAVAVEARVHSDYLYFRKHFPTGR